VQRLALTVCATVCRKLAPCRRGRYRQGHRLTWRYLFRP